MESFHNRGSKQQGSLNILLGQLLVTLFINDLESEVNSEVAMLLDDTKLFKILKYQGKEVQKNLFTLATKWQMRLNGIFKWYCKICAISFVTIAKCSLCNSKHVYALTYIILSVRATSR